MIHHEKAHLGNADQNLPAHFAQLATNGVDAARIAAQAAATWRTVEAALSPIIGVGGVSALYRRSLHLLRGDYPWLAEIHRPVSSPHDYAADLQSALAQRPAEAAAAANVALLQTFHNLLITLVGSSLTERLLGSVWEGPSSNQDPQDGNP